MKFPILGRAAEYSFLWPIAKGLAAKGHQVTVIASESPQKVPEVFTDGVHALYVGDTASPLARYPARKAAQLKFAEIHRTKPFHLVHSLDGMGTDVCLYKRQYQIATAVDVKATQLSQLFAILGMSHDGLAGMLRTDLALSYKFLRTYFGGDRRILKSSDGVFVTSPQQRVVLERYYMYPDSRIYTVPYGIEIGDLSPKEKSLALREQWKIPEDAHVVVTITDLSDVEEMENLFEAFEKVAIKKPNSRLIVVGQGPKRKEVEYEMYMRALGGKVILAGAVTNLEVSDYIGLADVFVNLSSRTTGFEPSMLEAMAQKKVVIGSEVSAIANIIEDGVDGFLIRPADTQTLASLLISIFTGQLVTLELGDRARRKVVNLFDTQKMVDETINAYFKIMKRTGLYKYVRS
jgi:glycosyltransferase involved in cell wall biosynthesis